VAQELSRGLEVAVVGRWSQAEQLAEEVVDVDVLESGNDQATSESGTSRDEQSVHRSISRIVSMIPAVGPTGRAIGFKAAV